MRKLDRLIRDARRAASIRGHTIIRFYRYPKGEKFKKRACAKCLVCGKGIVVDADPLPNETDIGGEAVALYCNSSNYQERKANWEQGNTAKPKGQGQLC